MTRKIYVEFIRVSEEDSACKSNAVLSAFRFDVKQNTKEYVASCIMVALSVLANRRCGKNARSATKRRKALPSEETVIAKMITQVFLPERDKKLGNQKWDKIVRKKKDDFKKIHSYVKEKVEYYLEDLMLEESVTQNQGVQKNDNGSNVIGLKRTKTKESDRSLRMLSAGERKMKDHESGFEMEGRYDDYDHGATIEAILRASSAPVLGDSIKKSNIEETGVSVGSKSTPLVAETSRNMVDNYAKWKDKVLGDAESGILKSGLSEMGGSATKMGYDVQKALDVAADLISKQFLEMEADKISKKTLQNDKSP
eukprot:CAMPEP_0113301668 /NCGR_PEP_ID=MMETSP0010_2-20120614/2799_1 /TAXON_ID=216773 ORGANISM="Corethron hystrix, Strain 308" /NCGR_SAMPLE_ID=MMETSP0010_2 /ASSEMBLY_ACC=CAM_ASM_000155 /LENGTH=310 /DNA_ID=CAMNT_0000155325 /DNA_START=676 /DNA_END=1608 /DNA_ORIENTATION=+ /assembly_acc=CAM_ASM_000155